MIKKLKNLVSAEMLSLLLLIAMLGLIIYLSQNRYIAISEAREDLVAAQESLDADQLQLLSLQELEKEKHRFEQRLKNYEKLIPQKSAHHALELFELEEYIYEKAYLVGIHQLDVRFLADESFDEYIEVPLTLTLEGSYHQILQFTQTLREAKQVFRVDTVDLYLIDEHGERLDGHIKLSTFYRN